MPEASVFAFEMAVENLKELKSTDNDKFPIELIKVGSRTIPSEIHKRINSIWNVDKLLEE